MAIIKSLCSGVTSLLVWRIIVVSRRAGFNSSKRDFRRIENSLRIHREGSCQEIKVPDGQIDPNGKPLWYLPHQPVIHEQKLGKVRVVFDCAARFGDTSLNDQLLQGPDLTNNLPGLLLRFRQESVALMADVEQMFHQVRVAPDDCHALRFLWWEDGDLSKTPVDHQMLVRLFGATSSPGSASFALKKTARDFGSGFDGQTVDTMNHNFYVDDCLKSVATFPEASGPHSRANLYSYWPKGVSPHQMDQQQPGSLRRNFGT